MLQGKVSKEAAHQDYGVVFVADENQFDVDVEQTRTLREELVMKRGSPKFFDRGPGFESLAGKTEAEVDRI